MIFVRLGVVSNSSMETDHDLPWSDLLPASQHVFGDLLLQLPFVFVVGHCCLRQFFERAQAVSGGLRMLVFSPHDNRLIVSGDPVPTGSARHVIYYRN
jgi:hypothetical protein